MKGFAAAVTGCLLAPALGAMSMSADAGVGPAEPLEPYTIVEPEIIDRYKHLYKQYVSGDEYEPANGSVTFQATDISLPGNFDLPVELTRWVIADDIRSGGPGGGWYWNVPLIRGHFMEEVARDKTVTFETGGWRDGKHCSQSISPRIHVDYGSLGTSMNHVVFPHTYWEGKLLHIPGRTSEKLLTQSLSNGSSRQATKSNFIVQSCISIAGSQEGFVVQGPDGTRYTFDRIQTYDSGVNPYNSTTPLRKFTRLILATKVEDRFGNTVQYVYDRNNNLTDIKASDGRHIHIDYEPYLSAGKTAYRPTQATASGKTWRYQYTDAYAHGSNVGWALTRVVLPDDTFWDYSTSIRNVAYKPNPDLMTANHEIGGGANVGGICGIDPHNAKPVDVSVKTPTGVHQQYTFTPTYHGRSKVDPEPVYVRYCALQGLNSCLKVREYSIARNLNCSVSLSLTSKTVSGPELEPQNWQYQYSENAGTYDGTAGYDAGTLGLSPPFAVSSAHGLPSNIDDAEDYRTATVIGPDAVQTYYIDRRYHSPTEGIVIAQDTLSTEGEIYERTEHTYSKANFVGDNWWRDSIFMNAMPTGGNIHVPTINSLNPSSTQYRVNRTKIVSQRYYMSASDAFTVSQSYDGLGFITKTIESNSFSSHRRYTKQDYLHDRTRWILGLPKTTQVSASDSGYVTTKEIVYHETANTGQYTGWYLPYLYKSFGAWIRRYPEYHTASVPEGALKSWSLTRSSIHPVDYSAADTSIRFTPVTNEDMPRR